MSIRSIVEINHDYLDDLKNHPKLTELFIDRLFRIDNREGEELTPGVRFLRQRHHSEKIKLIIE